MLRQKQLINDLYGFLEVHLKSIYNNYILRFIFLSVVDSIGILNNLCRKNIGELILDKEAPDE